VPLSAKGGAGRGWSGRMREVRSKSRSVVPFVTVRKAAALAVRIHAKVNRHLL